MPFRGTGLVQARGCNVERAELRGEGCEGGRVPACPRGEGSRPKRGGRKGVVGSRGEKGLGY